MEYNEVKRYGALFVFSTLLVNFSVISAMAMPAQRADESLRIREMMPIHFGNFAVDGGVGSVEVDARSGACKPSGVVMIRSTCARGEFEIYGAVGSRVLVQVVHHANHSDGVAIDNITTYPRDGIVTIGSKGLAYIYVGAKVTSSRQKNNTQLQANYHLEANYLP